MSPSDQLLTVSYLLETNCSDAPASLAEAEHRLDEDDKREKTDHGHAHRGNGFEDRAILGPAQHGGPVRQNQYVCQQEWSDHSVEHLGIDDECDEVPGRQGDGGADPICRVKVP
jgi:hypothetical protein